MPGDSILDVLLSDPRNIAARARIEAHLDEIRHWRKEVYEARQRMTPEERERDDSKTEADAASLGLQVMNPEDLSRPGTQHKKQAG